MGEVGPPDTFRHTFPHTFSTGEPSETSNPGGPIDTSTSGYTNPGGPFSSASDPNVSSTPTDSSASPTDTATSSSTPPPTSDSSSSSMTTSAPSTSPTGIPANSGSGNGSDPLPISTAAKHGLSGGSTAGLVIGLLALLGILGALFYLWQRRRAARGGANRNFLSFGGPSLSAGGGGRGADAYTEQKPRSRPTSRYVIPQASSTPFVPTATDLLPRHHHTSTQSVGTVVSDMAHTHESHGTFAGVDDSDYLEKLEDAEANIGSSVTSGTTLAHGDSPFLAYDAPAVPNRPSPSKTRDTRNRRSTGDAMVIVDHNYGRYDTEPTPPIPRPRSKSQDLGRAGDVTPPSPTTYPPVPTSQPTSPVAAASPPPRKIPRKKPVPRYSEEASRAKAPVPRRDGSSTPPSAGIPPEFEGKPVHYLIPDMPAPQR